MHIFNICLTSPVAHSAPNSTLELQSMLPDLQFRSLLPPISPHLGVVSVMAPLAERGEVKKARRFRAVVEDMRGCKHNFGARNRVGFPVFGPAPLATIAGTDKADETAPQLPVGRVSFFILRANWHNGYSTTRMPVARQNQAFPRGPSCERRRNTHRNSKK